MRITFINQYYKPLANPPAKRLSAFAEYFAKKKWDVKVITGQPNYPTGRLIKGYNWFWKKEQINGVKVYRFAEIPLKNEGFVKRLINYLSFAFSSLFSFPIIAKSDIVFISSPPIFSAIPLFFISKLFGKKVIFDVRDLWPESAVEVVKVKKGFFYNITFSIVKKMYKKADLVTCVSEVMKKKIKSYVDNDVFVVYNFADKNKFVISKNKKIKIVYTGILTKIQDFLKILPVNKDKKVRDKFEWHIVGDGEEFLTLKKKFSKFDNIFFYGFQTKKFCDEMIQSSDIGIVPLVEQKLFKMALPSKAMQYASFGKPIFSNWSVPLKNLLGKYDAGYYLDDIKDMKKILLDITEKDLRKKAKNSKKLFDENFDKEKVCEKLFERVKGTWY